MHYYLLLTNNYLTNYSRLEGKDLANEHRGPKDNNELSMKHLQAALDRQKKKWSQRWEDLSGLPIPAADNEETGKEILKLRSRLSRRETTMATLTRSECIRLFKAFLHPGILQPYP